MNTDLTEPPQAEKPGAVPEAFVRALTDAQESLSIYVTILMGADQAGAKDVLQETNLYLWKNAAKFESVRDFSAWAKAMAFQQVRKYRLYRMREGKKLVFDETVFEAVAQTLAADEQTDDQRLAAFRHCLGLLSAESRELLNQRFLDGLEPAELAKALHVTRGAVNAKWKRRSAGTSAPMPPPA